MAKIRPLQDGDEAGWMRMRFALWPDYTLVEMQDEMATVRADERQPVFVAEGQDGTLCGLVEVAIHSSAPGCHTEQVGYLEAWYVDPAMRHQGIGRALVAVAESWARAQGAHEMASDTDPSYPLSPSAHARLGYETVACLPNGNILFRKELPDS
jgi:aminoglycoside 6'-N-acetyltransferase I